MLEVELWDYHLHTHFTLVHDFKKSFKFYFQSRFKVNMFLEISFRNFKFWKNNIFGKTIFGQNKLLSKGYLSKCFNMIELWHMLILYVLQGPKHSNPRPKSKTQVSGFWKFWFFRTDRNRSTVPVDRRAQTVHVRVSRPPRSTEHSAVLSGRLGRPWRSTVDPQRSDFWPLAVDRPGRPAAVRSSNRLQQLYFSDCFCWDLHPTSFSTSFTLSSILYI